MTNNLFSKYSSRECSGLVTKVNELDGPTKTMGLFEASLILLRLGGLELVPPGQLFEKNPSDSYRKLSSVQSWWPCEVARASRVASESSEFSAVKHAHVVGLDDWRSGHVWCLRSFLWAHGRDAVTLAGCSGPKHQTTWVTYTIPRSKQTAHGPKGFPSTTRERFFDVGREPVIQPRQSMATLCCLRLEGIFGYETLQRFPIQGTIARSKPLR